jgi:hypothetical protein
MGEQFFDDLAKGLDDGTITRRRALKLVGGAALGAALMPVMPKQAEALTRRARRRCRRKSGVPVEKGKCHCAVTCNSDDTSLFSCNGNTGCVCLRTASGRGFCATVETLTAIRCVNTTPCASGRVCVVLRGCNGSACTSDAQCGASFSCINGICQFTTCAAPCPTM